MGESTFDVIYPVAVAPPQTFEPPARSPVVSGCRIGLLSVGVTRSDAVLAFLREALIGRNRSASVTMLPLLSFQGDIASQLAPHIEGQQFDLLIIGIGTTGSNAPMVLRASQICEQLGMPSVAIVAQACDHLLRRTVAAGGWASWPLAIFDCDVMSVSDEQLQRDIQLDLADLVEEAASSGPKALPQAPRGGGNHFTGSLDEVQEYFRVGGRTDGLPIIPPTAERVAQFLHFSEASPAAVLGEVPLERNLATVEMVAVLGVMAGCRPEYMPLLVSVAGAMCDPLFRAQDAGATPGWQPLVTISGPIVDAIDVNVGAGVMQTSETANSSIGRFATLLLRNLGGWNARAGTDMSAIGRSTFVAFGENEAHCAEIGWPTYGAEHGLAPGQSGVSVQSALCESPPIYSLGRPEEHAATIAQVFGAMCSSWVGAGYRYESWAPLLVMCPPVASAFAAGGWTKADLRQYLADTVMVDVELMLLNAKAIGLPSDFTDRLQAKLAGGESTSVSAFPYPESIGIVIAGDPRRNQSRGYLQNHRQGAPVTRVVDLPDRWNELSAAVVSARH